MSSLSEFIIQSLAGGLRPLLAVGVSLAAAGGILLLGRRPNLRDALLLAAAAVKFALVASMVPDVLAGRVVETAPLLLTPTLALHLRADALGLAFAALSSALWVVTAVYSITYMRTLEYGHQTGYHAAFAVCLGATMGIAFAGNLLTFFVFYELLTVATYPLVVHRRTPEAVAAGRKYLVYTLGAGQVLLVAVLWTQHLAPGGGFTAGGFLGGAAGAVAGAPGDPAAGAAASLPALRVLFTLFVVGLGAKAAIMPLHGWLPTAMIAPTPVSALLHAVAVVKAGVFGILRVTGYVFGPEAVAGIDPGQVLAWVASLTMILASLRALAEDNLKRRLAYSTVGQLSYVVLGAALGAPAAFAGAVFHITAHALMKITLFFCAGAIYAATHKENVSEFDGLGRSMPVTVGAFGLGALGITGMPFIAGFVSKWTLGTGAAAAGRPGFIVPLLLSGVLSLGYLLPVVYRAYFGRAAGDGPDGDGRPEEGGLREAPAGLVVPLVLTALAAVALGLLPDLGLNLYELAATAARSVFGGGFGLAGGGP